jgi:hypothetical protein
MKYLIYILFFISFAGYSQNARFKRVEITDNLKIDSIATMLQSGMIINGSDTMVSANIIYDYVDTAFLQFSDTTATIATRYDIDTLTNAVYDTLSDHLDTLQAHNTKILANLDSLADHLDTLQAHDLRIIDVVDSLFWSDDGSNLFSKTGRDLNILSGNIAWTNGTDIQNDDADTLEIAEAITKIRGSLFVTGNIYEDDIIHLFSYFGDSAVSLAYSTSWTHLTNVGYSMYVHDELDGFTISNDTITILRAGDYDLTAFHTHDGDNAETVSIRFYNVTQTAGCPVAGANTTRGANNFMTTPVSSYFEFAANDKLILQYKGDANGTAVFKNGIIKIYYKHE